MIVPAGAISPHRLLIVTGHFGTGKTEFSVNLALALARAGEKVMMADLDIVNPYFRSRERREALEAAGVRLITSSQDSENADMPSLPAEILTVLEDRSYRGLLDIGGDPDGARVLARYQPKITAEDYQLLFVSNANLSQGLPSTAGSIPRRHSRLAHCMHRRQGERRPAPPRRSMPPPRTAPPCTGTAPDPPDRCRP